MINQIEVLVALSLSLHKNQKNKSIRQKAKYEVYMGRKNDAS